MYRFPTFLLVFGLFFVSACAPPRQVAEVTSRPTPPTATKTASAPAEVGFEYADAEVPPFVNGKMWVFNALPVDVWKSEYDLDIDSTWTIHAQRAALRLGEVCSAGFVSARGLVLTNHHCVRDFLDKVNREDERLLSEGFVAVHDSLERRIPDLFVDELLRIEDITAEVLKAASNVRGAGPRMDARRKRADAIERRMNTALNEGDSLYVVEVFETYSAAMYSAYVYRRHRDVRLVLAPSEQAGYFGGDTDNFTWPRHTLDMAFLRVYSSDGRALEPEFHFSVDSNGVDAGTPVFVVGNPGMTNRLAPVSVVEFDRDVRLPKSIAALEDRRAILKSHSDTHRDVLANDLMALENMLKSERGTLAGLLEGDVLPVRAAYERDLLKAFAMDDSLRTHFGDLHDSIRLLQQSKRISSDRAGAFTHFINPAVSSHILARAMYGYVYALSKQRGADDETLRGLRKDALEISDWPPDVERDLIALRLQDLVDVLGPDDPSVKRLLGSMDVHTVADSIVAKTNLVTKNGFKEILDENYLASRDVTVAIMETLAPLYFTLDAELSGLITREHALMARLEEGRFRVEGPQTPPDASFKLRVSDGRVLGIGDTEAFTTFSGLYHLAQSYTDSLQWALPEEFAGVEASLSHIPLNFVSTTDISGGNSGSPVVNRNLELVGLAFDSNWEALASMYVYGHPDGRTISVDIRAILGALQYAYQADRLLEELLAPEPVSAK